MLKYSLWIAGIGLVAYNSVYVKPLDQVKAAGSAQTTVFAADSYAQTFWNYQTKTCGIDNGYRPEYVDAPAQNK